jgi:hypothetical protein
MHRPDPFLAAVLAAGLLLSGAAAALQQTYAPFTRLLERHVVEHRLEAGGLVSWFDYSAALADDDTTALLQRQDALLAGFDPATLTGRESALAFWINAYNYFMIRQILIERPDGRLVTSVRDYGSLIDPYQVFGEARFDVGGTLYSLRQIELDILLGDEFRERGWKDARIHFAVNCASVGCPSLRRMLFTADTLDRLLRDNTRLALDTPLHLRIETDTLMLTSLFDWYREDFIEHSGSIREFIRRHGSARAAAAANAKQIEFIDYDWQLNIRENFAPWLQ